MHVKGRGRVCKDLVFAVKRRSLPLSFFGLKGMSQKAFVRLGYVKRYKRNMFIDSKQHTTRIGSLMLH
jgi:hypothetical protein